MFCFICGSEHVRTSVVDVDGSTLGLPKGTLKGVERTVCHECGESFDSLPAQGAVIKEYRVQLAHLARPLTGEEFAFLRRTLGVNGSQYAEAIGVSNVTISRVENGAEVTAVQDALIRTFTLLDIQASNAVAKVSSRDLGQVSVDVADILRKQPREITDGWQDLRHERSLKGNVISMAGWIGKLSRQSVRSVTQVVDEQTFEFESPPLKFAYCGG